MNVPMSTAGAHRPAGAPAETGPPAAARIHPRRRCPGYEMGSRSPRRSATTGAPAVPTASTVPAVAAVAGNVLAVGTAGGPVLADRLGDLDPISYSGHRLRGGICAVAGGPVSVG